MSRLIVIYAHTHREVTPNRDLYTYSLSWSHALPWFIHILIGKQRLIGIYTHSLSWSHVLPWFSHILFIVKPRLIVIYMHTLYREATPNRDLCTYSSSWSHAFLWLIHILSIVKQRLIGIDMDTPYWHIYPLWHFQLITKYEKK